MDTLLKRGYNLCSTIMSDTPVESVNFKIKTVVAIGLGLGCGMIELTGDPGTPTSQRLRYAWIGPVT